MLRVVTLPNTLSDTQTPTFKANWGKAYSILSLDCELPYCPYKRGGRSVKDGSAYQKTDDPFSFLPVHVAMAPGGLDTALLWAQHALLALRLSYTIMQCSTCGEYILTLEGH